MSLPQIAQLEITDPDLIQQTTDPVIHQTFDWDFNAGEFRLKDGKATSLTGIAYLKVWIEKALRTERDKLIYSGKLYGSEHHSLIGRNFHPDFTRSEYERMITETLLQNDAITAVDQFQYSQDGSQLTISLNVVSIYGTSRGEVII